MFRSLIHHRGLTLAVLAGAAVATAVLTGALMVGDSVRGSLRQLTLDRLGAVDWALVGDRFFRDELAEELAAHVSGAAVVPLVMARGSAIQPDSGARASRVRIHGIDARFADLFDEAPVFDFTRPPTQIFPSAILNESLAAELGAQAGEDLLLGFGTSSEIPRETLMGESDPEDVLGSLRLTVASVIPDAGPGRFGLTPNQADPFNVFVPLADLQRALDQRGRVNALLAGRTPPGLDPGESLQATLSFDDLGLTLVLANDHGTIGSREFILRPDVDRVVREVLDSLGAATQPVVTYLANEIRSESGLIPYSSVTGVDPIDDEAWGGFSWASERPHESLAGDAVLLGRWAAEDLKVVPGDTVEMAYFEVGPREELILRERSLRVAGIVELEGLAGDASLTPEYPGIQQAQDMAGWDPPFPVRLDLIRERDEEYWDRHRTLPKAFVSYESGAGMWSTRYGSTTTIRFGPAPGLDLAQTADRVREGIRQRLSPEAFGFVLRPVREEGLRASAGATDFGGLFIGFSLFLIASAAMLVSLLFGLGVERRAAEIGLLLAVGYPVRRIRNRLLGEGAVIAAVGAAVGVLLGVGYAWSMMAGLRTIWVDAVGSSRLFLHVQPGSLILGWAISVVIVLFSVWTRIRRLKRIPPSRLLAGSTTVATSARRARASKLLTVAGLLLAVALAGYGLVSGRSDDAGLAFGAGASLLLSGLGAFAWWCRSAGRRRAGRVLGSGVMAMAARNTAWSPGRSILSAALVASACFVIVVVAANGQPAGGDTRSRESGSGGFPLLAEAQIPLHQRLDDRTDLLALGFSDDQTRALEDHLVVPLRTIPGDDASCLNLYRPERPTILGVPHNLVERGGFTFQQAIDLPAGVESPWELLETPLRDGAIPVIGDFNSTMWILHLALGDELELMSELGETVRLRLVATLASSVFQSELLISEENLIEHFPGRSGYGYFLIDSPATDLHESAVVFESVLAPFGFDVVTSAEKLESYKVVEHTYMATFQLLGGLGLLLGTVGLAVILLRNMLERRGELATLRAFGFRRTSLARMILAENLFLLTVGIAIGTLSALVGVAPRLVTIDVPWASIGVTLAVVLLVGMLASVAAVRGALRIPLLPALKAEH